MDSHKKLLEKLAVSTRYYKQFSGFKYETHKHQGKIIHHVYAFIERKHPWIPANGSTKMTGFWAGTDKNICKDAACDALLIQIKKDENNPLRKPERKDQIKNDRLKTNKRNAFLRNERKRNPGGELDKKYAEKCLRQKKRKIALEKENKEAVKGGLESISRAIHYR